MQRPNSQARLQWLRRLSICIVALLMISVTRPGAEDGTLHAFSGAPAKAQKMEHVHRGAAHDLGNPTRNFWGLSTIDPANTTVAGCNSTSNLGTPSTWQSGVSVPAVATGICYNSTQNLTTWQARAAGDISCEASLPPLRTSKVNNSRLSIAADTSCKEKYAMGSSLNTSNNFPLAYRILKSYAETCYDSSRSWQCFGDLDESVQFLNDDKARFTQYREWLKSVIWLNQKDPYWFCSCVQSLMFSYQIDTSIHGANYNATMAISYYVQKNHLCPRDSNSYHINDSATRYQQHELWLDTCRLYHHDTTQFPMDTTLPTLHDLGLDILLNPPQQHATVEGASSAFATLRVSQNPFENETDVSFTLPTSMYVSFQVSDVLGRIVLGDYKGAVLSPGEHYFEIDGKTLRSGTYYIRLTTANGETRTVKIVKE